MIVRIIGDVHGDIEGYTEHLLEVDYSIQVGDMSISRLQYQKLNENVPLPHHVFVPGNHDNYDNLPPHALGDFGLCQIANLEFFWVRGADSPDKIVRQGELAMKVHGKTWWDNEQVSGELANTILEEYEKAAPSMVITHDCPSSLTTEMGSTFPTTFTQKLLEDMYLLWQPDFWIFGHWHQDKVIDKKKTQFICLNKLSYIDWDCERGGFV